ncbi:hypothetical protein [Methylobacterium sp. R2-1]|uniref:hypothetical protein n=1 Tax=Methylobacterium sp. R2-1 TaxID=2587064 RepID=UPI0016110C04|nr:hypothetical protein [Methylobacterium sp. R2-1]MBB2960718.1 hypothetical protein [Methylobacterium sp. R2-1]
MSPKTLNRACAIARRCGTDAATALLNEGLLSEEAFYKALARRLKTPFLGGSMRLGDGLLYPHSLVIGAAPLAPGSAARVVAAPRGAAVARLIRAAARLEYRPAITTPTCLRQVVFARHGDSIATEASEALEHLRPDWSCRPGPQALDLALVGTVLALLVALVRLPSVIGFILLTLIQALMLALLTFRLAAVGTSVAQLGGPRPVLLTDARLPTYTVLVALYREAAVVPRLVRTLARLDYPVLCSNLT